MPAFFLPAAPPEMTVLDGVASTVKSDRVSWIIIVEPALTMGAPNRAKNHHQKRRCQM